MENYLPKFMEKYLPVTNASEVAVDIYRYCYPVVDVPPYGIELVLFEDRNGKQFVIVNMTSEIRKLYLKEAVNLMLEIYGICYVFEDSIYIENMEKRQRRNWEMLPPGESPSRHVERQLRERGQETNKYCIQRLKYMESFSFEIIAEGINGFMGYYAFVFSKYCVLESAIYGNATYIIPKDNWEILSQKTKKDLFDEKKVVDKIIHTANWQQGIREAFSKLGVI